MESVGRLAGGVAHDFNNMLSVILACAESGLEQAAPGDPAREDLEEIRAAATRSAELTRQLLAFARKQTVVPKTLDLNEAVGGTLKMLQRLIGEHIDLQWRPGPGAVAGADGSVAARPGARQPLRQRARRDHRQRAHHHRDAQPPRRRGAGRKPRRAAARRLRAVERERRRRGHGPGDAGARLRALLHHQGAGQGHRPRPRHRLWDRHPEPGRGPRRQRAGPGLHLPHLPASPRRAAGAGRDRRARVRAPRRARVDPAGRGRAALLSIARRMLVAWVTWCTWRRAPPRRCAS